MLATILGILTQYKEGLLRGLLVTLTLCAIVWLSGMVFGVLFGALAHRKKELFGNLLSGSSFLLSSIPILVLLFWLHYPFQQLLGIVINPFITASFALSLVNTIFVAQIVKNVLGEFPQQYSIAGRVCGLSEKEIVRKIELPIIFRQIIPQFLSLQVQMLQMTLFASLISVEELFRVAQQINAMIYKPIEIYTTLALFFLCICLPLNMLASWLKDTYTRNLSEA